MATGLLALLDDIASVLDDVAILTKAATRKTVGVLGDDLALNAQQVAGVRAERELPVVWAVAKGSAVNKAILVPGALAISAFAPWGVTPLLMIGGAFLCYEGFEKVAHRLWHRDEAEAERDKVVKAFEDPATDLVAVEKAKIKGAIRTDFILSAEIIVISLGLVTHAPFVVQVTALVGVAVLMTVGVYGLVAAIVKLDDIGQWLTLRRSGVANALGRGLLVVSPWLMKFLGVAGTIAMFLVGGGILVHGWPWLHYLVEPLGSVVALVADLVVGFVAGALIYGAVELGRRVLKK